MSFCRTGGTVRLITNEGTSSAHEMDFSLAAQSGKAVSINFTTPANGVLSITAILPDGTRMVDGKTLKLQGDASEKRTATRQADGTWKLEWKPSSYSGPTVIDGGLIDPGFVAWKQQRITKGDTSVADPANYARAVMAYAEEIEAVQKIVDANLNGIELIDAYGIGGAPNASSGAAIWDPHSAAYLADQAMHLYESSKSVPGLTAAEIQTLQYTAAGRLFLGVAQRAAAATDDGTQLENLAAMTAAATRMQKSKVLTVLRASSSAVGRVAALRGIFNPTAAEKGDFSLRSAFTQPNACGTTITAVSVSMPDPGTVRLRFNYSSPNFGYDHGNIYLLGPTGSQISNEPLVSGDFRHTLYVDIPLDRIAEILHITGESSDRFLDLRFKIALWEHAGDSVGIGGTNVSTTLSVNLKNRINDLSTLPAGPQHDLENKILKQLADPTHFAVRNPGQWYWLIGSDHHDGNNYNAVDLNLAAGDQGVPVYASADGKIIKAGDDTWHTVTIEHALSDGTKWYTKYLHMQNLAVHRGGQILPLTEGMQIFKDDQIGEVGDVGAANGQFHLHFEVMANSSSGTSIDLRSLLTDTSKGFGMATRAFDVGPDGSQGSVQDSQLRTVAWDPVMKAFATIATDPAAGVRLVADRTAQLAAVDEAHSIVYWRLEEYGGQPADQMRRVVSKTLEYLNENGVMTTEVTWVDATNDNARWDPIMKKFVNRLTRSAL